jgi:hypothetical protein
MDGVCGNLNRRHWCIVTISHKSLAAAHVTYAHVHVITPGTSWHRITILPYRLLHMLLTLLAMSVRLHVRRQNNHATTLP